MIVRHHYTWRQLSVAMQSRLQSRTTPFRGAPGSSSAKMIGWLQPKQFKNTYSYVLKSLGLIAVKLLARIYKTEIIIFSFLGLDFFGCSCCHWHRDGSLTKKKKTWRPRRRLLAACHFILCIGFFKKRRKKQKLSTQTKQVVCKVYTQVRLRQPGLSVVSAIHSVSQYASVSERVCVLLFRYTAPSLCKYATHDGGAAQFWAPEEFTNQCTLSKLQCWQNSLHFWTIQSWAVYKSTVGLNSPVKALACVYKQMKCAKGDANMPACSVIVAQRTQPRSSCGEISCIKCVSVAPKLKPKLVYWELLWRSNIGQLAPPSPIAFSPLPQKVVCEEIQATKDASISNGTAQSTPTVLCSAVETAALVKRRRANARKNTTQTAQVWQPQVL